MWHKILDNYNFKDGLRLKNILKDMQSKGKPKKLKQKYGQERLIFFKWVDACLLKISCLKTCEALLSKHMPHYKTTH